MFQLLEFERFLTPQSRENPLSVTRKQVVRHIMCSFIHNGQILGPKQGENVQRTILFHFVLRWNHCNPFGLVTLSLCPWGGSRQIFKGCKYTWHCIIFSNIVLEKSSVTHLITIFRNGKEREFFKFPLKSTMKL